MIIFLTFGSLLAHVDNWPRRSCILNRMIFIYTCFILLILQEGHLDTIENLSDEMREDYLLSVKKAIGR